MFKILVFDCCSPRLPRVALALEAQAMCSSFELKSLQTIVRVRDEQMADEHMSIWMGTKLIKSDDLHGNQ